MNQKQPVTCGCPGCALPVAYVQNGALVIESRHHGARHVNVLPLTRVIELLQEAQPTVCGLPVETAEWLPAHMLALRQARS